MTAVQEALNTPSWLTNLVTNVPTHTLEDRVEQSNLYQPAPESVVDKTELVFRAPEPEDISYFVEAVEEQQYVFDEALFNLHVWHAQMCTLHGEAGSLDDLYSQSFDPFSTLSIMGGIPEKYGQPCHVCKIGTIGMKNKCVHCGHDETHKH